MPEDGYAEVSIAQVGGCDKASVFVFQIDPDSTHSPGVDTVRRLEIELIPDGI